MKLSVATSGARGKTFLAAFGTAAPQVPIAAISASTDDGDVPSSTLDNDCTTRWSAQGDGQWIQYDFPAAYQVSAASLAFYVGTARTTPFDVLTSLDGTTWTKALSAVSSGTTNALQTFAPPAGSWATHVRIVGHGNSQGTGWNSITEVRFTGPTTVATYADYRTLNFTAAQQADAPACPAGDGVTNLMKYSQGLPPFANVSGPGAGLPAAQVQGGYLTLTYVRLKNATNLVYTPEVSGDLSAWHSGSAYTTQLSATDLNAARQQVVVCSNVPTGAAGRPALRLRVSATP